jgi:ribosomal-protein-alanine N-acetyltransferase
VLSHDALERMWADAPVCLKCRRLVIWLPPPEFAPEGAAYMRRNAEHIARFNGEPVGAVTTKRHWEGRFRRARREFEKDQALQMVVSTRRKGDAPMVGMINFTHFMRGPFQACFLGVSLDKDHEGQGKMKEALQRAIRFIFDEVGLHRIMGNTVPANTRSQNMLLSLGFKLEGRGEKYLYLGGKWRDHLMFALTDPKHPGPTQ